VVSSFLSRSRFEVQFGMLTVVKNCAVKSTVNPSISQVAGQVNEPVI
jgi:hypothetical protein